MFDEFFEIEEMSYKGRTISARRKHHGGGMVANGENFGEPTPLTWYFKLDNLERPANPVTSSDTPTSIYEELTLWADDLISGKNI